MQLKILLVNINKLLENGGIESWKYTIETFLLYFFFIWMEKLTRYQTNLGLLKQSCDIKMFLFQRSTYFELDYK